mgnify:CR=1 FL=1
MSLDKNVAETPWRKRESVRKKEARFELCMPKYPYINCLFDNMDRSEYFLNFWVLILSRLPLLQEGANWRFPATFCSSSEDKGVNSLSSHNRLWKWKS